MSIHLCQTKRFRVLDQQHKYCSENDIRSGREKPIESPPRNPCCLPVVSLYDIFEAHGSLLRRSDNIKHHDSAHEMKKTTIQLQLFDALVRHGFVLIKVPKGRAASTIQDLRTSLHEDFFPPTTRNNSCSTHKITSKSCNHGNLKTSTTTYVSERGVPMYKLGYELCEDNVREVFRIATGHSLDSISMPKMSSRKKFQNNDTNNAPTTTNAIWNRGIGLLRHTTDAIIDLLLLHHHRQKASSTCNDMKSPQLMRIQHRPHSGVTIWWGNNFGSDGHGDKPITGIQKDRDGDYSVLYAMHYFNDGISMVEPGVAVKEHVDPSLLVIEPFLCATTTGLQVWDRGSRITNVNSWIDCDGPNSPLHSLIMEAQCNNEELMLLFAGKALSEAIPSISPTLHRVVTGQQPRHTIIYEQKYAEFYPTPTFD